jgi:hypothetical protein
METTDTLDESAVASGLPLALNATECGTPPV